MKKLPVTVKSAWITSVAIIVAAFVAGTFGYFKPLQSSIDQQNFNSLLLDIPPGSTVTILIKGTKGEGKRKLYAKFEKIVGEHAKINLIEEKATKDLLNEIQLQNQSDNFGLEVARKLVDYIVIYEGGMATGRTVQASTGLIVSAVGPSL